MLVLLKTQSKIDYFTASDDLLKSSHCLGADMLMKLLKNYCRTTEMAINVGVVGMYGSHSHIYRKRDPLYLSFPATVAAVSG